MTIRTMTPAELDSVIDWAAGEGWNPGLEDAAAFLVADPGGFFVSLQDGVPIAAISVVNHSPDFAFLGLYICRPEWRGKGLGLALWDHALLHAGSRVIGLDGVAAQQANYAKSGFVRSGATRRLEGRIGQEGSADIRPMTSADLPALLALDERANGYTRPAFLVVWLQEMKTRQTLVLEAPGGPVGFATIRLCRSGAKIGPIVAPDAAAALRLIRAAAGLFPDCGAIIVDVPDSNTALSGMLEAAGMVETFATARMYKGTPPPGSALLHAPATLELG
ncbi:MAG: GNAT family N-acetyltransferase [Alphaproteobacteria bacterium]|nr:GNAT family N-acetyltransferase [Alphaproteobacteria bacterium]MBU0795649.1 GNAT family N-acetyltransferase [Alphaproteobacteria bacterium]MBU0887272.1 GNAT family N-acetyltransferase [Alphaproteobacteria bacterium]MBU1811847.1 GNAT family N-acetyltransferase [Alphaproteobacteria bacterium]